MSPMYSVFDVFNECYCSENIQTNDFSGWQKQKVNVRIVDLFSGHHETTIGVSGSL